MTKGYLTLFGSICVHLFIGNLYLWGNINHYVLSYYHHKFNDPGATETWAQLMLPITFLIQTCFNPVGAYLQKRWNVKVILLLGCSIMLGGIYLASIATNWWLFFFMYSFVFPTGIGLVYWTPVICCWEWFPDKKGLMTGLIVGAFGLGAFFFGFITTAIVNPDNEKLNQDEPKPHYYSEAVSNRVPLMFQVCLIIWGALSLIAVICVSRNP